MTHWAVEELQFLVLGVYNTRSLPLYNKALRIIMGVKQSKNVTLHIWIDEIVFYYFTIHWHTCAVMHVFTVRVSHCSSSRADTGLQWLFLHPSDDAAAALWCFATGCTFQSLTLSYHAQQCMKEWMNGLHSPLSDDPFPYFGVIHWSSQSLSSAHWVILLSVSVASSHRGSVCQSEAGLHRLHDDVCVI